MVIINAGIYLTESKAQITSPQRSGTYIGNCKLTEKPLEAGGCCGSNSSHLPLA